MKERPILFRADMVRALLARRKTQTRRPIREAPEAATRLRIGQSGSLESYVLDVAGDDLVVRTQMEEAGDDWWPVVHPTVGCETPVRSPFGLPGDRLWVRETHYVRNHSPRDVWYRANCGTEGHADSAWYAAMLRNNRACWRPSIHMPRWASRITLGIKRVWVERLADISLDDCCAEGIGTDPNPSFDPQYPGPEPDDVFMYLWDSIYGKTEYAWENNPWVWACEFAVAEALE